MSSKKHKKKIAYDFNKCRNKKLDFSSPKSDPFDEQHYQINKPIPRILIPQRLIEKSPGTKSKIKKSNVEKCFTITQINSKADVSKISLLSGDFDQFDMDINSPFMNETIKRQDRGSIIKDINSCFKNSHKNYKPKNRNNRSHRTSKNKLNKKSLMSRQNSGSGMLFQATPKHASKVYVTSFLRKETKLDSFFKSIGIYQKYLELKESRNNSEENDDVKL